MLTVLRSVSSSSRIAPKSDTKTKSALLRKIDEGSREIDIQDLNPTMEANKLGLIRIQSKTTSEERPSMVFGACTIFIVYILVVATAWP